MSVRWIDSHCHIQERYLDGARGPGDGVARAIDEVLTRAREGGVDEIVCIGTDPQTSKDALALAQASEEGRLVPGAPKIFSSVGLHPHDAANGLEEITALIEEAKGLGASRLVGVGECGLDYYYDHADRTLQRDAFAHQIGLAHRFDLTLVVHARDAWDDLFTILSSEGVPARTILHCFSGGPSEAERCLALGCYLSYSGIITFKNAQEVREAAARTPLDRCLIETDSPFLAPVPHRGKANEPGWVRLVGETLALLHGIDAQAVAAATRANTHRAFAIFGAQG